MGGELLWGDLSGQDDVALQTRFILSHMGLRIRPESFATHQHRIGQIPDVFQMLNIPVCSQFGVSFSIRKANFSVQRYGQAADNVEGALMFWR